MLEKIKFSLYRITINVAENHFPFPKLKKMGGLLSKLVTFAILALASVIGWSCWICFQSGYSKSAFGVIECFTSNLVGGVADLVQNQGASVQCQIAGNSVPTYPFSPFSFMSNFIGFAQNGDRAALYPCGADSNKYATPAAVKAMEEPQNYAILTVALGVSAAIAILFG